MDATLRCRCGEVTGRVANAAPGKVNRVVCYCDDCQAFLHHLGRADLLVANAGSDIVQVAPASLTFLTGQPRIAGLRLTPKGLFRWYATCCSTPLGNTLGPAIPFVGVIAQAFDSGAQRADLLFGRPVGAVRGKFAVGTAPDGAMRFSPLLVARMLRMILGWRLLGRTWPHPFFDRATRAPFYPITILPREQREALRPLCGPHPAAG
jgi:hypothetical protein